MPVALRELERDDVAALERFYTEVYLPAFAHQREPLEVWRDQLAAPDPRCRRVITLARDQAAIVGGAVGEWYPRAAVGFLTYLVVVPSQRRAGVGRQLLDATRASLDRRAAAAGQVLAAVVGEVADPDTGDDPAAAGRLARFRQWGARELPLRYVQPALGPGLDRDRHLRLLAFFRDPPPAALPAAPVVAFVRELYAVTEGIDPLDDPEQGPHLRALPPLLTLR